MADDETEDYTRSPDTPPVYSSGEEALKHKPTPVEKDPGETAPEIPKDIEGTEGDPAGIASPDAIKRSYDKRQVEQSLAHDQAARDSLAKLDAVTQPLWAKYRGMLQQDQQQREQENQQMLQQLNQREIPQQQKNNFWTAFGTMLLVALPIALAFGRKGNGFAQGAMMAGLGAAIDNFAKGREKAGQQAMKDFNEQARALHQNNQERSKIYHDILTNRRLELDDQFKMIHSVSQQFWDPHMAKPAREKNMDGVTTQLQNQDKVNKKFKKGVDQANKLVDKNHAKDWPDYVEYIRSKSRRTGHEVDANVDRDAAEKIMPYDVWRDKYSTPSDRARSVREAEAAPAAKDPNAPMSDEERAKARSSLFDKQKPETDESDE